MAPIRNQIGRALWNVLAISMALVFACGLANDINITSLKLLTVLGLAGGLVTGLSRSHKAQIVAGLLILAMVICHFYIQILAARAGVYSEVSMPLALLSIPTVLLVLCWSFSCWSYRGEEVPQLPIRRTIHRQIVGIGCAIYTTTWLGIIGYWLAEMIQWPPSILLLVAGCYAAATIGLFSLFLNLSNPHRQRSWDVTTIKAMIICVICKVTSILSAAMTTVAAGWAVFGLAMIGIALVIRRTFADESAPAGI